MEKLTDRLPKEFVNSMKTMLGDDFNKFEKAMNEPLVRGLRVNTNRVSVEKFCECFEQKLEKVDYAIDGFVLESDDKLGNSIEHLTGQIYLQEPASMLAVCASGIEQETKTLKVLDLCASPGGKSGQIAARIGEDSILFSNEIISSRASVLFSNIERLGFRNVVVLNEKPENLACFEGFFDYVFVDAPCSGEGMFRKNPETISEWSKENVKMCADRQKDILEIAQSLVAPNGKLIYSTCTFSEEEDENIVEWFIENFNFELQDVPEEIKKATVASKANVKNFDFARKHFQHTSKGEGQFIAVFKNNDTTRESVLHTKKHFRTIEEIGRADRLLTDEFFSENTTFKLNRRPYQVGNNLYLAPKMFDSDMQTALDSLKFVSIGVKIGSIEKGRFEPNHNLFMTMGGFFKLKIELEEEQVKKYLHGEELRVDVAGKGYAVVTKNGFVLGGAKLSGGRLKNLYPKGIRI